MQESCGGDSEKGKNFSRNFPISLVSVVDPAKELAPARPRLGFCGYLRTFFIMARLFGTDIPNEKRIEASLPYIFGIGRSTAAKILDHAGVDPDIRTGELSEEQLVKIATVIQNESILIEGDLRREKQGQMKRLSSINCYRGIRHKRGLPVRGQRTRTNSRTRKGKRRTVGVAK